LLDRISIFKPCANPSTRNAEFFGPSDQWLTLAIRCKDSVCAFISALLLLCGPSHVSGFIVAIIVDALKLHSFRACSENLEESIKSAHFFGNPYSSPAITRVRLGAWILDAKHHIFPCKIGAREKSASLTVCCGSLASSLYFQTSARFNESTDEMIGRNIFFCPAFASTFPHFVASFLGSLREHGKTRKNHSSQIVFHCANYMTAGA